MGRSRGRVVGALVATGVAVLLTGACGDADDDDAGSAGGAGATTTAPAGAPRPNACPTEGCRIAITDATRAGEEIRLTFEANFTPDLARNHFHVYWDTYTAEQVSDDAETRFGQQQGNWVPTDENPYTTSDETAVAERGESIRLCATAGDRDHNVIDPHQVDCRDVSDLL